MKTVKERGLVVPKTTVKNVVFFNFLNLLSGNYFLHFEVV